MNQKDWIKLKHNNRRQYCDRHDIFSQKKKIKSTVNT
jgi:hypothetical protein